MAGHGENGLSRGKSLDMWQDGCLIELVVEQDDHDIESRFFCIQFQSDSLARVPRHQRRVEIDNEYANKHVQSDNA